MSHLSEGSSVTIDVSAGVVAFNTGIQRVIRALVANWPAPTVSAHKTKSKTASPNGPSLEIDFVVWDSALGRYRNPTSSEAQRLDLDESYTETSIDMTVNWWPNSWLVIPDFVHDLLRREAIRGLKNDDKIRLAYVVHDCVPVSAPETSIPEMTPAFSQYLTDISNADLALTVSDSTAEELAACLKAMAGGARPDLPIVAAPLANEGIKPHAHRPKNEKPTRNKSIRLLCVGSSEPRKNHTGLLFACEVLWQEGLDFQLDLVATRGWSNREEVDLFNRLQVKGRLITWHKDVADLALSGLYQSSDVFVFPSLHEGFGLPVIEALAAGLPVVTSRFGAMGQTGKSGGCLLIDINNDDELIDALRALITDEQLRSTLKTEALAREPRPWVDFTSTLAINLV